jgi:UDP-N-acetylmuramoyl-L-alanyl-D-glutamate--2,6-diaminopimelate ligase
MPPLWRRPTVLLAEIMQALHAGLPNGWQAAGRLDLRGVTADSRKVAPGFLFAALPGAKGDGRAFIGEAVARGAAAVLVPDGTDWPAGIPPRPLLHDPEPRRRLAQIAAALAGVQPAHVVAVTGTNGKTSVVEFTRQIWEFRGHRAASLGTLGLRAEGFETGPGLTTPGCTSFGWMGCGWRRRPLPI